MSEIFPSRDDQILDFVQAHLATWATNAASIGADPANVTSLASKYDAANNKKNTAVAARQAAEAATADKRNAIRDMLNEARVIVKQIKAFAPAQPDPDAVYALAEIPAPKNPSPRPAPPTPENVSAVLNQVGAIDIAWKGAFGSDVFFTIERQVTPAGGAPQPWAMIGSVDEKNFTDAALPPNTFQLSYRIFAIRNGKSSASSEPGMVQIGAQTASTSSMSITGAGDSTAMAA